MTGYLWLDLVSIIVSVGCIIYNANILIKHRKERRHGRNRRTTAARYSSAGYSISQTSTLPAPGTYTSSALYASAINALAQSAALQGASTSMSSGPPPGNATRDDSALPDIEVGRKALRTFNITREIRTAHSPTPYTFVPNDYVYQLKSLYGNHVWKNGMAIATCRRNEYGNVNGNAPCESPPGENCRCGLYGTLGIEQLLKEYGNAIRTNGCIAVFTAEGETVIGSAGLRTSAARIVGYWVSEVDNGYFNAEQAFKEQCPEAKKCDTIAELLKEFGFEPFKSNYGLATAEEELTYRKESGFSVAARLRTAPPSWYPTPVSPASAWSRLAPLLTAATPGGIAALQALGSGPPTTSSCKSCGVQVSAPGPNQIYKCAACVAREATSGIRTSGIRTNTPQAPSWLPGDKRKKDS